MTQIAVYDTTLRDGTQGEGISLSVDDKLRITKLLDDFGVAYIEGGWPGSNPKDAAYFQAAKDLKLKHAKIAAFGMTCRTGSMPDNDPNIQALLDSETPVVTVVANHPFCMWKKYYAPPQKKIYALSVKVWHILNPKAVKLFMMLNTFLMATN